MASANTSCELLGSLLIDNPLPFQVTLVPTNNNGNVGTHLIVQLPHPLLHLVKGLLIGDVINKHGAVGIPIIDWAKSMETFLPCSIPQSQ
eukprot:EC836473.1.p2 GENE.EC836473.1~~EC836473.1.p2  ORF type:complete len:90 (-),score=6.06 EC836473.1:159-428(-)